MHQLPGGRAACPSRRLRAFPSPLSLIPPAQKGDVDAYDAQARNQDQLDPTPTLHHTQQTERGGTVPKAGDPAVSIAEKNSVYCAYTQGTPALPLNMPHSQEGGDGETASRSRATGRGRALFGVVSCLGASSQGSGTAE